MSRRASILERLRRLRTAVVRQVVAAFALAYVSVGVAPCAAAGTPPVGDSSAIAAAEHDHSLSAHAGHPAAAHDHGTTAHGEHAPASHDHGDRHCPHCPGAASMDAAEHASCFTLEDLARAAASHAKDAAQPLAPPPAPAPFTLPPPLAAPPPPLRAVAVSSLPLNVRHCVFLI